MSSLPSTVESLNTKIDRLIELHKSSLEKVGVVEVENQRLAQKVKEQKGKLLAMEEQAKVLRLAKTLSTEGEKSSDLKLKINEVVREIDKCIALLNK